MPRSEDDSANFVARAELLLALRSSGLTDRDLLKAFEQVPHEVFVPDDFKDYAYKDAALPLGFAQSILSPHALARLFNPLDASGVRRALLVGTGSGYSSAVLGQLARRVFSLERHWELLQGAEARWRATGIANIVGLHADGLNGYAPQAPYDRIVLSGSVEEVPGILVRQLAVGGILVAAVGPSTGRQTITRMVRGPSDTMVSEHGTIRVAPLAVGKMRRP